MTFLVTTLVFPLLFAAVALGCGLLLEALTGRDLPGTLLVPAGFAVVIVASSFTTMSSATAGLTSPLVVVLAVVGFGLRLPFRRRVDTWAAGAAVVVFAVYAAPIVLSGSATFAGYISLDDTATWLALADHAMTHGRALSDLPASSYSTVLHDDLGGGYPLGALVPLGIAAQLTARDAAWLFQPYLAFLAALLALSIYSLVTPLVRRAPLRAFVAVIGAQPALLYGYAFWSGIKELTVAYLVALLAALSAAALASPWFARTTLPLAVAAAAVLDALSVLGLVWLAGLGALATLVVVARRMRNAGAVLVALAACAAVLAVPALATARVFVRVAGGSEIADNALGNLIRPLDVRQVAGIWPAGDFRLSPAHPVLTNVLIALLVVAAGYGCFAAVRRRVWGVPLYVLAALSGCLLVLAFDAVGHGSPWLDAKALASASPAVLVAGLAGIAVLAEQGYRVVPVAVAAAVLGGVVWSNELAYGSVWLAPRGQLAELESIGHRFAGDGPTLMTEYQPYGVRHFLRRLDPEGASERRARIVALRSGGSLDKAEYADIDAFDLDAVLVYRTLVLRTSPSASRPPSVYVPVWSGGWYEVWQRPEDPRSIIEHLSLGGERQPVAVPRCADVLRLAELAARNDADVVAALRAPVAHVELHSTEWPPAAAGAVVPTRNGDAVGAFAVERAGRYGFWLGGSYRGRVRLSVDGRVIGSSSAQLEETAQLANLGTAALGAGRHDVELRYEAGGLRPGRRGAPFALGPLEVGRPATKARLVVMSPGAAGALCGRRLDWIEVVAR